MSFNNINFDTIQAAIDRMVYAKGKLVEMGWKYSVMDTTPGHIATVYVKDGKEFRLNTKTMYNLPEE